ncbi:uncharacterized protein ACLA_085220 [Aspergillus clavatus NRRL 1]|uniref:Uncharacterized protein n=1 Tax=Aspergillus clavatus (strain ATCC 1007 / CBS 513.65 / DSM 816 / NCTC 3887 / NRRL 1 / QM 1276 / 107) TaxID=344612 RepID=A1CU40_ASPCL|nr:uncharacterized protein ACLA_085220 [Aspergillus clavatus NRRL 1]EAW06827.1 hypothetical protein ACLA_085220 [Aspergillus clavatus NRRL 1]
MEAYFDGQELLICRTKPYDFTFLNTAGFKTFAQWFLGDPSGDTSREAVRTQWDNHGLRVLGLGVFKVL